MATTPRRPRAAALAATPERPRTTDASARKQDHHAHGENYVLCGTLLALIFLTATVFLFMLFPFFMPARSLLSMQAKQKLCTEFVHQGGVADNTTPGTVGITPPGTPDSACATDTNPVCGEIQVQCIKAPCPPVRETYANKCLAGKAGATVVSEGVCAPMPEDLVKVSAPLEGDKITSPITVKGMAFGGWFSEGSFPVQVTDLTGKILGQGTAGTTEDWTSAAMAGEKVSFTAKISFKKGTAKSGFIVLKRDNPSGLPENDAQVKVSVTF